jgi:ABC-type protease/lipase transport system fused ATPase/permease subunit
VIAHRPAVLATVDQLLVLRDGAVEMLGPRAEIVARLASHAAAADRPAAPPAIARPASFAAAGREA